jgi:hypothetical protein
MPATVRSQKSRDANNSRVARNSRNARKVGNTSSSKEVSNSRDVDRSNNIIKNTVDRSTKDNSNNRHNRNITGSMQHSL